MPIILHGIITHVPTYIFTINLNTTGQFFPPVSGNDGTNKSFYEIVFQSPANFRCHAT